MVTPPANSGEDVLVMMTTYKRTDGSEMLGEYTFVCDYDSVDQDADGDDGPIEYVEEVWVRQSFRVFTLPLCRECDQVAIHWGLCEQHARADDPEAFDAEQSDGQETTP